MFPWSALSAIIIIIWPFKCALICGGNILEISLFLGEHPHIKVSFNVRLERGGDDEVFSWGKTEAVAHFSQVYEGLGARCRTVGQEEAFLQVCFTLVLEKGTNAVQSHGGALHLPSAPFCHCVNCVHFRTSWWKNRMESLYTYVFRQLGEEKKYIGG